MHCGHEKLHRHGYYGRDVLELGKLLRILVARFLCVACHRTTSCLPGFALPYRLVATGGVEAFLLGAREAPGLARCRDLLQSYRRRWCQRAPQIEAVTGAYLSRCGRGGEPAAKRLLRGLLDQWGSLACASVRLLADFGESPLGRYRIHAWARVARGSVDPLRKIPPLDSS